MNSFLAHSGSCATVSEDPQPSALLLHCEVLELWNRGSMSNFFSFNDVQLLLVFYTKSSKHFIFVLVQTVAGGF